MSAFHPQMMPIIIVPMTFLFVLSVILVAKAPRTGAWLVGALALLFPLLVFRAVAGGVFATPVALPLFLVPMTFLFVLLIVLMAKLPQVGAWIVAGLVFLFPTLVFWGAKTHAVAASVALPMFIVPLTFLFVLVVVVLAKTPKAGAGLVAALVLLLLSCMYFGLHVTREEPATVAAVELSHGRLNQIAQTVVGQQAVVVPKPLPPTVIPPEQTTPAPIWSASIEKEMDADIYPSKAAAIRALGSRLDKSVRALVGDVNEAPRIVLFQQEVDRPLIVELKDAIGQVLPQAACRIEAEQKNLNPGEVGVTVHLTDLDMQPAPWMQSGKTKVASGTISLSVSTTTGGISVQGRFAEKPWIENFATFASNRPEQAFIIARSTGTCTSESEARQQAMQDASQQVGHIVWNRRPPSGPPARDAALVSPPDLERNGLVVDTFVQSFDGSVGKIWRQAVLLDVSGAKITQLFRLKSGEVRHARESWARMGLSAVGVVVLIGVIYFFLNMATMGYYEWSLRIAGAVLAIVGVLSILMVVR